MNVRKPVDYSAMFAALDTLMAADLPQMELYCEIGRLVSGRPEKGAAVAAAEYLCAAYPDVSGFSPRNLRRMREFYRTYESIPEVLADAMAIGWTQNVVILEAELTPQERAWYIKAAGRFGWSKLELQRRITDKAHLEIVLDFTEKVCYTEANSTEEIGRPVYPPARRKLAEHGIRCDGHSARQLTNQDYDEYDLLIGMDQANLRSMYRICGGDYAGKMHLLLDFTDRRKGTPRKPSEAGCAGRGEARERPEFSPQAETEKSGLCFDDVADPWYTDDFEATWQDVLAGCQGLLKQLWESR